VVRVSGYGTYFAELKPEDVQDDIIARMEHALLGALVAQGTGHAST
jgi:hypothetical protein